MQNLIDNLYRLDLDPWRKSLETLVLQKQKKFQGSAGHRSHTKALRALPDIRPAFVDLDRDRVSIGRREDASSEEVNRIEKTLRQLCPWRKGPFDVFGIHIDSEWASNLKWNRLANEITPLTGRRILDVGSSNGYYMFRMAAAHPEMVLGIEPYPAFYFQFLALQHFVRSDRLFCIPAGLEEIPDLHSYFDTVFCMGILYHRSSPVDTLTRIRKHMKTGGELVLETLIIGGTSEKALFPKNRYAKMSNVYFLPTIACLMNWMQRSGFTDSRCINIAKTTTCEQSGSDWVDTESLDCFLDPADPDKTVEGYPAPVRAIVIARNE